MFLYSAFENVLARGKETAVNVETRFPTLLFLLLSRILLYPTIGTLIYASNSHTYMTL